MLQYLRLFSYKYPLVFIFNLVTLGLQTNPISITWWFWSPPFSDEKKQAGDEEALKDGEALRQKWFQWEIGLLIHKTGMIMKFNNTHDNANSGKLQLAIGSWSPGSYDQLATQTALTLQHTILHFTWLILTPTTSPWDGFYHPLITEQGFSTLALLTFRDE